MGYRSFDLLQRHEEGQHAQGVTQSDHVVEPGAKKSSVAGQENMRKPPKINAQKGMNWELAY